MPTTATARAYFGALYLQLLAGRLDAKACSTGYSCGEACIPLAKHCRKSPTAAVGKERLSKIRELAAGDRPEAKGLGRLRQSEAAAKVAELQQQRSQRAQELLQGRQGKRAAAPPTAAPEAGEQQQGQGQEPTAQQLIAAGGKEWSQKGHERIYFNNLEQWAEVEHNKREGRASWVTTHRGEELGTDRGRSLRTMLKYSKVFYDRKTGKFGGRLADAPGWSHDEREAVLDHIVSRIKQAALSHPAGPGAAAPPAAAPTAATPKTPIPAVPGVKPVLTWQEPGTMSVTTTRAGRGGARVLSPDEAKAAQEKLQGPAFEHQVIDGVKVVGPDVDLDMDHGFESHWSADRHSTRQAAIAEAKRVMATGYGGDTEAVVRKGRQAGQWYVYKRRPAAAQGLPQGTLKQAQDEATAAHFNAAKAAASGAEWKERYEHERVSRSADSHLYGHISRGITADLERTHEPRNEAQIGAHLVRAYRTGDFGAIAKEMQAAIDLHKQIRAGQHRAVDGHNLSYIGNGDHDSASDQRLYKQAARFIAVARKYAANPAAVPRNVREMIGPRSAAAKPTAA
jgi:hypothetical protein